MSTLPYHPPHDDAVIYDTPGKLEFTDAMCSRFAGGPSQTVEGHIWVTRRTLAFRPVVGMPHPQQITIDRGALSRVEVVQRRRLWLFASGAPVVDVAAHGWGLSFSLVFHVDEPDGLVSALATDVGQRGAPRAVLTAALAAGETEPGRYVEALAALSFPGGFWLTESHDDLLAVATQTFEELGLPLGAEFLASLDLAVEPVYGPEDYETGPGSESWARRDQIERICNAANGVLTGELRLYQFAETLPDWRFDETVWLLLTAAERQRLLDLGVLEPFEAPIAL